MGWMKAIRADHEELVDFIFDTVAGLGPEDDLAGPTGDWMHECGYLTPTEVEAVLRDAGLMTHEELTEKWGRTLPTERKAS